MRAPLAVALLLVAACTHHSSSSATQHVQPAPPPGTGTQVVDMEGQWEIIAIERLDAGPAPSGAFLGAPLFLPVQIGQILNIRDGQLREASGAPQYEPLPLDPQDFYANTADGRVLWFEVDDIEAQPLSQLSVQAIFGSTDAGILEGYVSVFTLGLATQGMFPSNSPNGTFHVWARRLPVYPPGGFLPPTDQPTAEPTAQPISVR